MEGKTDITARERDKSNCTLVKERKFQKE